MKGNEGRERDQRVGSATGTKDMPDRRFSKSLRYGLALLDCFNAGSTGLRVSEIADAMSASRSTTHRYASTLVALELLEQNGGRRYILAPKAADIGMSVLRTLVLQAGSQVVMERLRDEIGHTVSLGVLDGARATYVQRLYGHRAGQYEADLGLGVGAHIPLYCTALGKALLGSLKGDELSEALAGLSLERRGPNTITSGQALTAELLRIRVDGIALCDEEQAPAVRSIAVAIAGPEGSAPMAVGVTVPARTYSTEALLAEFGWRVKTAAERIAANWNSGSGEGRSR